MPMNPDLLGRHGLLSDRCRREPSRTPAVGPYFDEEGSFMILRDEWIALSGCPLWPRATVSMRCALPHIGRSVSYAEERCC